MNAIRAKWAGRAVELHTGQSGGSPADSREALINLLCNLRHWAAEQRVGFVEADAEASTLHVSEAGELPVEAVSWKRNSKSKKSR